MLRGISYREIAGQIRISESTVKSYASNVLAHLGCKTREGLQAAAIRAAINGKLKIHLVEILGETWTRRAVKTIRREIESKPDPTPPKTISSPDRPAQLLAGPIADIPPMKA